jgi:hypothetical protein
MSPRVEEALRRLDDTRVAKRLGGVQRWYAPVGVVLGAGSGVLAAVDGGVGESRQAWKWAARAVLFFALAGVYRWAWLRRAPADSGDLEQAPHVATEGGGLLALVCAFFVVLFMIVELWPGSGGT